MREIKYSMFSGIFTVFLHHTFTAKHLAMNSVAHSWSLDLSSILVKELVKGNTSTTNRKHVYVNLSEQYHWAALW